MKRSTFLLGFLFLFVTETTALVFFAVWDGNYGMDTVLVNEAVWSVQNSWDDIGNYQDFTGLDYTVLDLDGTVLYGTKRGLSESINAAVGHRDTILDLVVDNAVVGKIIIFNDTAQIFHSQKQAVIMVLFAVILMQCGICIAYHYHLNRTIVRPFQKLKGFAERVASGNLDIPLEMDKRNLFGAFTESFDIMRSELKMQEQRRRKPMPVKKNLLPSFPMISRPPLPALRRLQKRGQRLRIMRRYGIIMGRSSVKLTRSMN